MSVLKEAGMEVVSLVKENKLVTGVIAAATVGTIIYFKRDKIMKKYNELKNSATVLKQAAKEAMNEEEVIIVDEEKKETKTV